MFPCFSSAKPASSSRFPGRQPLTTRSRSSPRPQSLVPSPVVCEERAPERAPPASAGLVVSPGPARGRVEGRGLAPLRAVGGGPRAQTVSASVGVCGFRLLPPACSRPPWLAGREAHPGMPSERAVRGGGTRGRSLRCGNFLGGLVGWAGMALKCRGPEAAVRVFGLDRPVPTARPAARRPPRDGASGGSAEPTGGAGSRRTPRRTSAAPIAGRRGEAAGPGGQLGAGASVSCFGKVQFGDLSGTGKSTSAPGLESVFPGIRGSKTSLIRSGSIKLVYCIAQEYPGLPMNNLVVFHFTR